MRGRSLAGCGRDMIQEVEHGMRTGRVIRPDVTRIAALRQTSAAVALLVSCLFLASCQISSTTVRPAPETVETLTPFGTGQDISGIMVKLTLPQLAHSADVVAVGVVADIRSASDSSGKLVTLVSIDLEETLKGQAASPMVIQVAGGIAGIQTVVVEDAPEFRSHERVVVFVQRSDNNYSVVGGFQGKFTIDASNRVGGEPLEGFTQRIEQASQQ